MRPHEAWAAKKLVDLLRARGHRVEKWGRGTDPPDFVFIVNGSRWAVEVTRMDQRVRSATGNRSRSDADTKLMAFGKAIAAKQRHLLKRPYVLTLRPIPGVTDTKAWRNKARQAIAAAVASDSEGPFLIDVAGCAANKRIQMG